MGCAVTSIFPNTEQRATSSVEKAAVRATAAKQGEKDNCGNKGGQRATESSTSTDLSSDIFHMPVTEQ